MDTNAMIFGNFGNDATYYEILEVSSDASPNEIRAAYIRVKAAYRKDSVALYTLFSEEDTQDFIKKVEEAYQVLSNPDLRREYDRKHGFLVMIHEESRYPSKQETKPSLPFASVDRIPPMDVDPDTGILIPPRTDYTRSQTPSISKNPTNLSHEKKPASPINSIDSEITELINHESSWDGAFIQKIRDLRRATLESLSDYTKINKNYLQAIEENNYQKLPAPVFLRGFLTQISKALKIPSEKLTQTYMNRYQQYLSEKESAKSSKK